jgi:hypothetical protein
VAVKRIVFVPVGGGEHSSSGDSEGDATKKWDGRQLSTSVLSTGWHPLRSQHGAAVPMPGLSSGSALKSSPAYGLPSEAVRTVHLTTLDQLASGCWDPLAPGAASLVASDAFTPSAVTNVRRGGRSTGCSGQLSSADSRIHYDGSLPARGGSTTGAPKGRAVVPVQILVTGGGTHRTAALPGTSVGPCEAPQSGGAGASGQKGAPGPLKTSLLAALPLQLPRA